MLFRSELEKTYSERIIGFDATKSIEEIRQAEQQELPSHASMKSWGRLIWNFRIFQQSIVNASSISNRSIVVTVPKNSVFLEMFVFFLYKTPSLYKEITTHEIPNATIISFMAGLH